MNSGYIRCDAAVFSGGPECIVGYSESAGVPQRGHCVGRVVWEYRYRSGPLPGHSDEVELRSQEVYWRVGRRVLDCPAINRIPAAGQHQGSTSAIRTATHALVAN